MSEVTRKHRETAALAISAGPKLPDHVSDWIDTGRGSGRVYDDVAQAIADAEARAASHPRAEPSDGERASDRQVVNLREYQCAETWDGPWSPYGTPHVAREPPCDWSDPQIAASATHTYVRSRVVRYVPASSVRTEQGGAWVACSERMPAPYDVVQFLTHGGDVCVGPRNPPFAHGGDATWEDMTDVDAACECSTYTDEQVTDWAPLLPSPPATNGGGK